MNQMTTVAYTVDTTTVPGQWAAFSNYDFANTLAKLKEAIAARDLWLIEEIDPQKLLMRAGLAIQPTRQLLFFHPRYMQRLLQLDARALQEAPLKIVVLSDLERVVLRGPDMRFAFSRYSGMQALSTELADLCAEIVAVVAQKMTISHSTVLKPPFTLETALAKVKLAQDIWNSRDPERVALAYTEDSSWRNRDDFFQGRAAIVAFLKRKWAKELDYRLMKELWAFSDNRISVRFEYEWHDHQHQWYRSHGNEQWEFEANGLMRRRDASINDIPIAEAERRYR